MPNFKINIGRTVPKAKSAPEKESPQDQPAKKAKKPKAVSFEEFRDYFRH